MKYRSLEDWNKKGKRIKKGERHSARTVEGVPLFSSKQVEEALAWYEEKDYFDRYPSDESNEDYDYDDSVSWDNFGDWGSR